VTQNVFTDDARPAAHLVAAQIAVSHPCRDHAGAGTSEVSTAAARFEFPPSFQQPCTSENQRAAA
jgi:hypothetical protein